MKKSVTTLISICFLFACESEESTDTTYDIECQGQADGWHQASQTINDAQAGSYSFNGEWHCKNEKLWYSIVASEFNLFGRFNVTKTDAQDRQSNYQYHFIQGNKAQDLIVQQEGLNEENNNYVESHHLTLSFLTNTGVLAQLVEMPAYSGSSYTIEYNDNSLEIAALSKTIFRNQNDGLYQYGTSSCAASNNFYWSCRHWDSYRDYEQNEENKIDGENTEKLQYLTPNVAQLLNNPLATRSELIRLSDKLFN